LLETTVTHVRFKETVLIICSLIPK